MREVVYYDDGGSSVEQEQDDYDLREVVADLHTVRRGEGGWRLLIDLGNLVIAVNDRYWRSNSTSFFILMQEEP